MYMRHVPSFFIIGVQKAATSSLHAILSQDTRISLPYRKETHFFSTNYKKGLNWYLDMFKEDDYVLKGEVDPSYLHYEHSLLNIKKHVKYPKLIIIFRKPIERAYSHYLMSKKRNLDDYSFNDALKVENHRLNNDVDNFSFSNHSYILRGEYSKKVKKCKEVFPNSDYLFLKFEDFVNSKSRINFIKKIYEFLDLEYNDNLNSDIHLNRSSILKFDFFNKNLYENNLFKKIGRFLIPSSYYRYKIIRIIENLSSVNLPDNIARLNYSSIDNKFIDWNNEETRKLSSLTGICFDDWIIK